MSLFLSVAPGSFLNGLWYKHVALKSQASIGRCSGSGSPAAAVHDRHIHPADLSSCPAVITTNRGPSRASDYFRPREPNTAIWASGTKSKRWMAFSPLFSSILLYLLKLSDRCSSPSPEWFVYRRSTLLTWEEDFNDEEWAWKYTSSRGKGCSDEWVVALMDWDVIESSGRGSKSLGFKKLL